MYRVCLFVLRWGLVILPTLASNSWAQVILLPQTPKKLGLQRQVTIPSKYPECKSWTRPGQGWNPSWILGSDFPLYPVKPTSLDQDSPARVSLLLHQSLASPGFLDLSHLLPVTFLPSLPKYWGFFSLWLARCEDSQLPFSRVPVVSSWHQCFHAPRCLFPTKPLERRETSPHSSGKGNLHT